MKIYIYDGPVFTFDIMLARNWHGETQANSRKKALNNLGYQAKQQFGYSAQASFRLYDNYLKEVSE